MQYLISHELGHYLCKHHILFNLLVFGTIPVLAVIALVLTNYVTNKPFSHAIAPMLGIWFVIALVYLIIKECTLIFEYQADAAGQRLLEKIEPGAYRAGLTIIYAKRIEEATNNKEKGKLQKRSEAKSSKLPIS
ncbi:M48 family metalloprotease [Comamonas thiooxydans]|uniref:M48 family metalloprotease n=1 Tax=Comamonas thiooxydans TaxID=363952 RepID=UPI00263ADDC8|nr:M48 family metalloprotease [Comamonas thiooxydans]